MIPTVFKDGDSMDFIDAIKQAGVVGAGGAGFPTHVKLAAKAETFIVNAAECEPLIETDKYIARTFAQRIVSTVDAITEHLQASRAVIALKGEYEREIEALQGAISKTGSKAELFFLPAFYPAGDEQMLVHLVCGKSVPERGIPLDVGAVVDNVGTVLSIADALEGCPVTDKYLSVVGEVETPVMLHVPVGTSAVECIMAAKPLLSDYAVIVGGPMMGKVYSDREQIQNLSVTKTTGNFLVLPREHALIRRASIPLRRISIQAKSACIQCRFCTSLCPRYLIGHAMTPHLVMRNLFREALIEDNEEYERAFGTAANCSECGLCEQFSCPMGLSPRKVNHYLKGRLKERGIQVPKNQTPVAREDSSLRQVPTERLIVRLNLKQYGEKHPEGCQELFPERVSIPFQQHIGKPAQPVLKKGDKVKKGELLAAAQKGLSANIHASTDGVIEVIDSDHAVIRRGKE